MKVLPSILVLAVLMGCQPKQWSYEEVSWWDRTDKAWLVHMDQDVQVSRRQALSRSMLLDLMGQDGWELVDSRREEFCETFRFKRAGKAKGYYIVRFALRPAPLTEAELAQKQFEQAMDARAEKAGRFDQMNQQEKDDYLFDNPVNW